MQYIIELTEEQLKAIRKNLRDRQLEDMMADANPEWEKPLADVIKALRKAKPISYYH